MLQRIQTVYLLIIVALTVATLFLPLAVLQQALTAIIAIIALVTIFLYKKRILQIRLCVFNALLILGFYGFFAFLIYSLKGDMEGASVSVKIALSFPLVNLILDYLAIRNIGADEALVRSLDRLR